MQTCVEQLESRLAARSASIGILGLGYVGLPLARAFCQAGYKVLGFDINSERVATLHAGRSPIAHVPDDDIRAMRVADQFEVTTDSQLLNQVDVALICVPTPVNEGREPDLSYVCEASRQIARNMRPGTLVVLESTTYPGTTEEVVKPILEESGLACGEGFFLAFSPEREDPGNSQYTTSNIPKLVGGVDELGGDLAMKLYEDAVETVVRVSDARTAEAAKLLENSYRSVNIALVNEMKMIFDRMGIDIWQAIEAAATKPFGFQPFYPGPGLGGHCIPVDPHYLSWRAKQFGLTTRFIDLASEVNSAMPDYVVSQVSNALNTVGKAVSRSEILVLGVAYKRDIDDTRESPALELISRLKQLGARVHYHDPHIPVLNPQGSFTHHMESVSLARETVSSADLVLIATDHSSVDYSFVAQHAAQVVDTRNCLPESQGEQLREFLEHSPTFLRTREGHSHSLAETPLQRATEQVLDRKPCCD